MPSCKQTHSIEWALDAANFFLADVQGGLGPYLAVYLLTERRWDEASIGVVMSIATAAGLLAQTPAAAQVVMVPMALLVGAKADAWGRKPLFLAGLAILPIRGVLYTLSDNSVWLVAVQLLDGRRRHLRRDLPVIVADLMRGTGRFNAAQGAILTAQGIGAALSTTLAGFVVVRAGYSAGFLVLAAIAAAGLLVFWLAMPESQPPESSVPAERRGDRQGDPGGDALVSAG